MSKIEWTEQTWNPVVGCSILSPGCIHCYAMRMAARIERMGSASHYAGTTKIVNGKPVWTGKIAPAPEHILFEPLRRLKPTMYFVNSMSDLFHEDLPDEEIDRVFAIMALTKQHTYQILTKRAGRMAAYFEEPEERAMQIGVALGNMLDGDWIWGDGKKFRKEIEELIRQIELRTKFSAAHWLDQKREAA